jgi:hypothetical protein
MLKALIAIAVVVCLTIASCSEIHSEEPDAVASTSPRRAFLAWWNALKLSEELKIGDITNKTLQLNAGRLELLIGRDAAFAIYRKLLHKFIGTSEIATFDAELQVVIHDDFCAPAVIRRTIKFTPAGIEANDKIIQERPPILCMLNFEAIRRHEERANNAMKDSEQYLPLELTSLEKLPSNKTPTQFLQAKFLRGKLRITADSPDFVAAIVDNIKAEIIYDQNFWERVQIILMIQQKPEGILTRLILDGKYAAGLSTPSEQSYVDMEPLYTNYLNDYGKQLVLAVSKG